VTTISATLLALLFSAVIGIQWTATCNQSSVINMPVQPGLDCHSAALHPKGLRIR
jgi:hypothetical protein